MVSADGGRMSGVWAQESRAWDILPTPLTGLMSVSPRADPGNSAGA
jgi:hypothetical protein